MARKRDYATEYRKRIERGLKSGKTRQRARGHKVREHVERRQREIEKHGLTLAQIRVIFLWGEKRNHTIHDAELDGNDYVEAAKENGYEWFKEYRKKWEAIRREYLRRLRNKTYVKDSMVNLESEADDVDAPDISWLYYH